MTWNDVIDNERQKDYYKKLKTAIDENMLLLLSIHQKIKYLMPFHYVNMKI
jgi:hypothetical protein